MADKVIHVSDEAHTKAKEYCLKRNIPISMWVAALIDSAIDSGIVPIKKVVAEPVQRQPQKLKVAPVPEKENPYAKPPFWAGK